MQSAQLSHLFDSRPEIKVIGVPEKNLHSKLLKDVLRNALDRGQRAHGHKDWGFDFAMRRDQTTGAGWATFRFDVKLNEHCENCNGRGNPKLASPALQSLGYAFVSSSRILASIL